jgi:hypothetical protein
MTADPRTRMDHTTIGNAFRNFDYEREIDRLKRSGGGGSGGSSSVSAAWAPGDGANIDIAGAWRAVPIPALTIEPSDAFTVSSNNVTVKDAGWYHVSATVMQNSAANIVFYAALSTSAIGGDGDIANAEASGLPYNRTSLSGSVKLVAGAKVYLWAYANAASPVNTSCLSFSITKVGGAKGDVGSTGAIGPQGIKGDQGIQGPEGLNWRGNFGFSYSYYPDDVVYYQGASYVCINQSSEQAPSESSDWEVLAAQGNPGPIGPMGGTMGATSLTTTQMGEIVSLEDAGWYKWLPIPTTNTVIEPSDAFTITSDPSIIVKEAGWYQINVQIMTAWPYNQELVVGILPETGNWLDHWVRNVGGFPEGSNYAMAAASVIKKLPAGQKIYIAGMADEAPMPMQIQAFSIARLGGPQGPKGDTGEHGNVQVGGRWSISPVNPANGIALYQAQGLIAQADTDPSFTLISRSGGHAVVIPSEGWYDISGWLQISPGASPAAVACTLSAGYGAQTIAQQGDHAATALQRYSVATSRYMAAGEIVTIDASSGVAGTAVSYGALSIVRSGAGPKGDKGDTGVQGIPGGTMGAAAGLWYRTGSGVTLALSTPAKPVWNYEPKPNIGGFVLQASNTEIVIPENGWYVISPSVAVSTSDGSKVSSFVMTCHCYAPGDVDGFSFQEDETGAFNTAELSTTRTVYLAKNWRVWVTIVLGQVGAGVTAQHRGCQISIARVGGPQGQVEVYTQPNEPPVTAEIGAIWIDTDEAPPMGGNVPNGGTAGQILTKTSAADGDVAWGAAPVSGITGQTYTMSGYAADRVLNAGATTMNELAAVLATLIDDMKAAGLIKP